MGAVGSQHKPHGAGGGSAKDFLLKGGHLRRAAFPFAMWPLRDVKRLLVTLKKVGTFVMVEGQFSAWISSVVPAISESEATELFGLLDATDSGRINCLEFLAGIMMLSSEDFASKAQFCFELYDLNLNGMLCHAELVLMVRSTVLGTIKLIELDPSRSTQSLRCDRAFEAIADLALRVYDRGMNRTLSYDEFVSWARGNREVMRFVDTFDVFAEAAARELQQRKQHGEFAPGGDEAVPAMPEDSTDDAYPQLRQALSSEAAADPDDAHPASSSLQLDWMYAYSGQAGKGNAKYLDSARGSIVYAAGTAVITQRVQTASQTAYTGHSARVVNVDVHPSYHHVASADTSGEVRVWEPLRLAHDDYQDISLHTQPGFVQVSFSRSGQFLAIASSRTHAGPSGDQHTDRAFACVQVWDWRAREPVGDSVHLSSCGRVTGIAWSTESDTLAAAGAGFVKLFAVQTGSRLRGRRAGSGAQCNGHSGQRVGSLEPLELDFAAADVPSDPQCTSLCFVGKNLVVGTAQGFILQFDQLTRKLERVLRPLGDQHAVTCIAEWKAGIVSASANGDLRLWDMGLHPLDVASRRRCDPDTIAMPTTINNTIALAPDTVGGHSSGVNALSVTSICIADPVRSKIALVATSAGDIFEINLGEKSTNSSRSRIPIVQTHAGSAAPAMAVFPRNEAIVASCSATDGTLRFWDTETRTLAYFCVLESPASCLGFAPAGDCLAVGLATGEVSIRDPSSAASLDQELARISLQSQEHGSPSIDALAFSPDGVYLAAACASGTVFVFAVRRQTLTKHKHFSCVQVLKSDTTFASSPSTRVALDWTSCSSFLRVTRSQLGASGQVRRVYWNVARGGQLVEDNLAAVRARSWATCSYPEEDDLRGLPQSLRRKATVFDVVDGVLAIGDADGKVYCAALHSEHGGLALPSKAADRLAAPAGCVKFAQRGKFVLVAGTNGAISQWKVVADDGATQKDISADAQLIGAYNDADGSKPARANGPTDPDLEQEVLLQRSRAIKSDIEFPTYDGEVDNAGDEALPELQWLNEECAPSVEGRKRQKLALEAMGVHEARKDADLALDWVQGYNAGRNNVKYLADRRVAFPACSAVTMLGFDDDSGRPAQRFLRPRASHRSKSGAQQAVEAIAVSPGRTHVAFGSGSALLVWNIESSEPICEVDMPWVQSGLAHVAFNTDGSLVAAVGNDSQQTVAIVDWEARRVQGSTPSGAESILDMVWSCENKLTTVGIRHASFWKCRRGAARNDGGPELRRGNFGVSIPVQNLYSVCAVDRSTVITGLAKGDLAVWDVETRSITRVLAQQQPETPCYALCSAPSGPGAFFAGNKAGQLSLWTRAGPDDFQQHVVFTADSRHPAVRSIDVTPRSASSKSAVNTSVTHGGLVYCVVALADGRIMELNVDTDAKAQADKTLPETLFETHSKGEAWALAVHPTEQIAATAADDGVLRIWGLAARQQLAATATPHKVISLAFGAPMTEDGPVQLAAGLENGTIRIYNLFSQRHGGRADLDGGRLDDVGLFEIEIYTDLDAVQDWVKVLQYSPDGSFLAAGSHDQHIYIFDRASSYSLLHKLAGHSSFVGRLDWSQRPKAHESTEPRWHMQSMSGSREMLFWHVARASAGRVTNPKIIRDIDWASWTCTEGWAVSGQTSRSTWTVCARTRGGMDIVAGGKDGSLTLCSFPCASGKTSSLHEGKTFAAHAAPVSQVCFSAQDRFLVSLDMQRCLCVWQTEHLDGIFRARDAWDRRSGEEQDRLLEEALQRQKRRRSQLGRAAGEPKHSSTPVPAAEATISTTPLGPHDDPASLQTRLPWAVDNEAWKANLDTSVEPEPQAHLADNSASLQWIYGRNVECGARFVGANDDILFVAANVAVIQRPVRDGQLARQVFFTGHTSVITALDVSTDGRLVATGDEDGHVIVWSAASLLQESSFTVDGAVQQTVFSPGGNFVGVLVRSGSFALACAASGLIKTSARTGPACAIAVVPKNEGDPDADVDIAVAGCTTLRVWTFDPVRDRLTSATAESPVDGDFRSLGAFEGRLVTGHADGSLVSWNAANASVWRIMTRKDFKAQQASVVLSDVSTICCGHDRREIICISRSGRFVCVDASLDLVSGAAGLEGQAAGVSFVDCDRAGRGLWLLSSKDGPFTEYDTVSRSASKLTCGHGASSGMEAYAFDYQGQSCLITAGMDARACVWDLRAHKLVREQNLPDAATSCAVSPSGSHVAVGTRSGSLVVFSAMLTRKLLNVSIAFLQGSDHARDAIRALQYSADGGHLAVGSDDGQIRIFETRNYALVRVLPRRHENPVTHLDWSVDGSAIRSNGCVQALLVSHAVLFVPRLTQSEYFVSQVADPSSGEHPAAGQRWNASTCVLTAFSARLCSNAVDARVPIAAEESCGAVAMSDGSLVNVRSGLAMTPVRHAVRVASSGSSGGGGQLFACGHDRWLVSSGRADGLVFQFAL